MITVFDILNHAFPDRGGWTHDPENVEAPIVAGDGGPVPTMEEIEAHREATEEALATRHAAASARKATRATLRATWEGLPYPWIKGPFQDKFEAAFILVDKGDIDSAAALIEYAEIPTGYTIEEAATFATVKAQLAAGIEALRS
jgi:hypothetical protein